LARWGVAPWLFAVLAAPVGAAQAPANSADLLGQTAPDFALPAAAGDNVRLSEYVGQPVIVTFWSSECGLCAGELSELDKLYRTYRSAGLMVLAVSVDDDMTRAARYAHAHRMQYPMLLDGSKAVASAYAIGRLPTTLLIDRSGVVRYLHDAYRANDASYVSQIRALLDDDAAIDASTRSGGD